MRPMNAPPDPKRPRRGRRRHRPRGSAPESPAATLSKAVSIAPPEKPVELPLTPGEVTRMKAHFQFLREHRKELKLRLNAAEDLLLNGVREPTHRGVCQHLLDKVERARVLSVAERLPPAQGVRFLGGVIRFAPEIGYIVRFLDCVRASSSKTEAAAALTEALRHLDVGEASSAQMRDLVGVIVELFPERELPGFFLPLLQKPRFREAFDRSAQDLPEAVSRMALPLRAVEEAIHSRGRSPRHGPADQASAATLGAGVALLLSVDSASLRALSDPARGRLFELGSDWLKTGAGAIDPQGLVHLFESLSFSRPEQQDQARLRLAGALLGADQERLARRVLRAVAGTSPEAGRAARWLSALDAPRFGSVALEPPPHRRPAGDASARAPSLEPGRWYRAIHLPTQTPARLRVGPPEEAQAHQKAAALWRKALVPGVARIVAFAAEPPGPYLAVALPGRALSQALDERGPAARRNHAIEVGLLLHALALAGLRLPDAALRRFNLDEGRVWLIDLYGAEEATPDEALRAHLDLFLDAASHIAQAPLTAPPGQDSASGFSSLIAALEAS